jgi:mannose-1-phosphate guanylyltransferase
MLTTPGTASASRVETTLGLSSESAARRRKRKAQNGGSARVVILAGGDGVRSREATRVLSGDERPKQFAALVGSEPLLVQTERRAALLAPADRTLIVLTRTHEAWYREIVSADGPPQLVIQPENRGTATGVLIALLRIGAETTEAPVVILPSDHWVSSDSAFMLHAQAAVEVVEKHPTAVVLLGVAPTRPETEYGWIESGALRGDRGGLSWVSRFVEKPSAEAASDLFGKETSLWNTSVVVARVEELLLRFAMARPELVDAFLEIWPSLGAASEAAALDRLYADLPVVDFSRDILASPSCALSVLAVQGVAWEDLSHPRGILEARRLRGATPRASEPIRLDRARRRPTAP